LRFCANGGRGAVAAGRVAGALLIVGTLVATVAGPARAICVQAGSYASNPTISYYCAFGLVDFDVTSWSFQSLGGNNIRVTANGLPALTGTMDCIASTFQVSASIAGSCTETYSLSGTVDSPGHWSGTFTAQYTPGGGGSCFDCESFSRAVQGTNSAVAVPMTPSSPRLDLIAGPSPSRGAVRIAFATPGGLPVRLEAYDLLGRRMETLIGGQVLAAGTRERQWRPARRPTGGLIFLKLSVGGRSVERRVVFLP
jgi:hypothetical protein